MQDLPRSHEVVGCLLGWMTMGPEQVETSRIADQMRRTHGTRAHAYALQTLAQATEDCNLKKVELWRYVSLILALKTPTRIA
jgi:hypothetical protein